MRARSRAASLPPSYTTPRGTTGFSSNPSLNALTRSPDDRKVRIAALEDDFAFHQAVIDLQKNGIISKHYRFNAARVRLFRLNMGEPLRRLGIAAEEHLAILDACEQRQPETAIALLTDHIKVSRAHTLGIKPM